MDRSAKWENKPITLDEQCLVDDILEDYDPRQIRLMKNCLNYIRLDPAGVPGHNLMIIIAKLCKQRGYTLKILQEALVQAEPMWAAIDNQ